MASYDFGKSPLTKRYVAEISASWVQPVVAHQGGQTLYTSALTQPELVRALPRRVWEENLETDEALALAEQVVAHMNQSYALIAITAAAIVQAFSALQKHRLQAYDVLPLACVQAAREVLEGQWRLSLRKPFRLERHPAFFCQYGTPKAIATDCQNERVSASRTALVIAGSTETTRDLATPISAHTPLASDVMPIVDKTPNAVEKPASQSPLSIANPPPVPRPPEPIAIVGMACRFPGGANSLDAYWQLLHDGTDAITQVPTSRWNIAPYYDPEREKPGKIVSSRGGFLDRIDQFDASFFGISPKEAMAMDPQHRLLLEVTWEALEHSNINPDTLVGSATGVYVGLYSHDYEMLHVKHNASEDFGPYFATGSLTAAAAGRIAYALGLQGPALSVDTASSSSLVAVHLACESLQSGDCHLALAAGVNLLLSPELSLTLSQAGMLSPDGRCKTFDIAADGYVRSEGCGVVVLKPLAKALADRNSILAVIRATAVNQDGASKGFMAPNGLAQEAVMRKALSQGGVSAHEVSYVEAHGTGTPLGDTVEVKALEAVYGEGRAADTPLLISSVKTNIGHTESAAGVAGLIKVVLSMQHGYLPPHLHLNTLNPNIALDRIPAKIPVQGLQWTTPSGTKRLAGVSSFGFSGTNAHAIVEEAPLPQSLEAPTDPGTRPQRPVHLLTLSAKTPKALQDLAQSYATSLQDMRTLAAADVGFTANTGRAHLPHRLAVVADTTKGMREQVQGFAYGAPHMDLIQGRAPLQERPRVAFLFTGQGAQYPDMGAQLYQTQPTFRRILQRCSALLRPELEQPLLEVLYPTSRQASPIHETAYTQPALFALEYALAELWRSWGIEPDVVMGHSAGEYVAACVAGVLSLEEGLKLIAARGRLMQELPSEGMMMAIFADEERVAAACAPYPQDVAIAAINGPQHVVLSGQCDAVHTVVAALSADGVESRPLQVSHAFHSPLMTPMLGAFEQIAQELSYAPPSMSLISTATGSLATHDIATPSYWVRHVREPVRFMAGMTALFQHLGVPRHAHVRHAVVEIGPQPTLLHLGRQCEPPHQIPIQWLPSLTPGKADWRQLLDSLGRLYVHGASVDWASFDRDYQPCRVTLPTYPWQRQRYWLSTRESKAPGPIAIRERSTDAPQHPLLGQRLRFAMSPQEVVFESHLRPEAPAFLQQYQIDDTVIVPASAYLEMALYAGYTACQSSAIVVEDAIFQSALILPKDDVKILQFIASPDNEHAFSYRIYSLSSDAPGDEPSWTCHATGKVSPQQVSPQQEENPSPPLADLATLQAQLSNDGVDVSAFYQDMRNRGVDYGPDFQLIVGLWRRQQKDALGHLRAPATRLSESADYLLHPTLLDASIQVATSFLMTDAPSTTYLPIGVDRMEVYHRPQTNLWSYARLAIKNTRQQAISVDLWLFECNGKMVARLQGLQLVQARREQLLQAPPEAWKNWCYQVKWYPQDLSCQWDMTPNAPVPSPRVLASKPRWLIFADAHGVAHQLTTHLTACGEPYALVFPSDSYKRRNSTQYGVNPAQLADFAQLIHDSATTGRLCGVVYLWGLDTARLTDATASHLMLDIQHSSGSALQLVHALAQSELSAAPPIWFVTRGAAALSGTSQTLGIAQTPLWGLGKVMGLEYPQWRCVLIDLDPAMPAEEARALLAELTAAEERLETHVALRHGDRHVPRLVPHQPLPPTQNHDQTAFSHEATYLITGGFGKLGLQVAAWLAERGARHLVLVGRAGPTPVTEPQIRTIEELGVQVIAAPADVSDLNQLMDVFKTIEHSLPPLRGVIHAAGVWDDGILAQQTWERFARVISPKAVGAWNLHTLTQHLALDFFVLFSSAVSLLGSRGQATAAAANAFLDGLAHARQAQGLPALSLNWGTWAAGGLAARRPVGEWWGQNGFGEIHPLEALATLEHVITSTEAQMAVMPMHWPRFLRQFPAGGLPPFFSEVRRHALSMSFSPAPPILTQRTLRQQVENDTSGRHDRLIITAIHDHIAAALGSTSEAVDASQPLNTMGFDSLMAQTLRNWIRTDLGVDISIVKLMMGMSLTELAADVIHQWSASSSSSAASIGSESIDLHHLNDDEVDAQLAKLIDQWSKGEERDA